jgi:hypothetical protein
MVSDCHQPFTNQNVHYRIQLTCYHSQIEGNKTDYQLARKGFECPFTGPQPDMASKKKWTKGSRGLAQQRPLKTLESVSEHKCTKCLLQEPSEKKKLGSY